MNFKKFLIILAIFFVFSGCQTIKEKTDSIAKKENEKYGKLVGKKINDLKIELGNPTEDYIDETGNKVFIYKTKKYGIPCERKFEINQKNVVESFTSSGCI
jgi:outer membrane lipoprotein-sorting protein